LTLVELPTYLLWSTEFLYVPLSKQVAFEKVIYAFSNPDYIRKSNLFLIQEPVSLESRIVDSDSNWEYRFLFPEKGAQKSFDTLTNLLKQD